MKYLVKKELEIRSQPSLEQGQVLGVLNPGFILDATDALDEENAWLRDNNGHFYWKEAVEEPIIKVSEDFELNLNLKAPWLTGNFDISPFWKYTIGKGVTVAVIDSGITQHEDLDENIDFVHQKTFAGWDIIDTDGHGNHIAGIIAARGRKFILGIAPGAKILPIKIVESQNRSISVRALIKSLGYLAGLDHVDIINISLNVNSKDADFEELKLLIKEIINRGKIIVAAAGNNWFDTVRAPAKLENVIAVTALDRLFDNSEHYFVPLGANYGERVDTCSIGYSIRSCGIDRPTDLKSGTSMAAAYVSGVIALKLQILKDRNIRISIPEIVSQIKTSYFGYANRENGEQIKLPILDPKKFLTINLM